MAQTKTVNVAIAGLGGVGRAVADLLFARQDRYRALYNIDVRFVAACGSRAGISDQAGLARHHLKELIEGQSGIEFLLQAKPDVLIEAGPSNYETGLPGRAYIAGALDAGVHTVVISKGALVLDSPDLKRRAAATGASLKVSGAAGAALPALDLLKYSLRGCNVKRIEGILNATTNYLLTAMIRDDMSFEDALLKAQKGGFAERDPRNDTEGWDTAGKLLILANFGLDAQLKLKDIAVTGIQHVTAGQIQEWKSQNLVPKLVGTIHREGNGNISASVSVQTYSSSDMFSLVSGKDKAVKIQTDSMGEVFSMGSGIEPIATAAAALKDLEYILEAIQIRNKSN